MPIVVLYRCGYEIAEHCHHNHHSERKERTIFSSYMLSDPTGFILPAATTLSRFIFQLTTLYSVVKNSIASLDQVSVSPLQHIRINFLVSAILISWYIVLGKVLLSCRVLSDRKEEGFIIPLALWQSSPSKSCHLYNIQWFRENYKDMWGGVLHEDEYRGSVWNSAMVLSYSFALFWM